MRGKVQQIDEKSGSRGTFHRLKLDGTWYSLFDRKVGAELQVGDELEFDWEDQKGFKTITGKPAKASASAPASANGGGGGPSFGKDLQIIRQTCLKAAAEVVGRSSSGAARAWPLAVLVAETLKAASQMEAWVCDEFPHEAQPAYRDHREADRKIVEAEGQAPATRPPRVPVKRAAVPGSVPEDAPPETEEVPF